jgi:GNAT superfamily N-acetyltransferase
MKVSIEPATEIDAAAIALLRTRVAEDLASLYGRGHWSWAVTERTVLRGLKHSRVLVARTHRDIVATLRLTTKKPWAIDPQYFLPVHRPIYLVDMAVEPEQQRQSIGRQLVAAATASARAWLGDAIRLDAYDGPLGAGPFYLRCGFRQVGRVTYRRVPLVYFERILTSSDDVV